MTKERKKELQDIAKSNLPDPIIILGFMEHQIDFMAKIIEDLVGVVDTSTLTEEQLGRITQLKEFLKASSVDFDDLSNPLQSYKLPKALQVKTETRDIQYRYITKQIDEGLME